MKVDQNSTVGGLQLIEVRRFLREVRQGYKATTEVGNVGTFFKIGTREAQTILRALIDAGYLTPEQPYGITRTGIGLCTTRFVPRINRAKADKIVVDLLQRVDAVNARDELTDRVKSVHAFGSYITDTDDLVDVDVAIT